MANGHRVNYVFRRIIGKLAGIYGQYPQLDLLFVRAGVIAEADHRIDG